MKLVNLLLISILSLFSIQSSDWTTRANKIAKDKKKHPLISLADIIKESR